MKTFENALREVACQLTLTDYLVVTSHTFPNLGIRIESAAVWVHKYHLQGDAATLRPVRVP